MRIRLLGGWWVWACAAMLLVVLAACGGGGGGGGGDDGGGPGLPAGDYMPMAAGDRWIYEQTAVRVAGTRVVGGETATVLRTVGPSGETIGESLYVKTADGVRELVPDDADAITRAIGPVQMLRLPLVAGDSFTQVDRTVDLGTDFDGDGRSETALVRSVVTVYGPERVVVGAGTFDNCARVRTVISTQVNFSRDGSRAQAGVTADEWLAPGIGPVKTVVTTSGDGGLQSTQTQALQAYGVGGRRSETVAPAVTAVSPADASTVGRQPQVYADFSERMDAATLAAGGFGIVDDAGQRVDGTLQLLELRATFVPTLPWASGGYTARIAGSATDRVGNPVAAERSWHFTVDATGPSVIGIVPADGASEVALGQAVVLTFSEPIDAASLQPGSLTLDCAAVGLYETLPVRLQAAGNVVTMTPTQPLPRAATCTVTAFLLADAYGNGVPSTYRSSFRTTAGRFAYPVALATGQSPVLAVAVADVNGDGRPDVLAATGYYFDPANDFKLFVFLQQADGTLAPPVRHDTGLTYGGRGTALVVADIDGDGRNDVVLGEGDAGVEVFLQNGAGTLASAYRLDGPASRLRVADMDGDGRPDIVALGFASSGVQVWRQAAGGGYGAATVYPVDHFGWESLAVGDFNGDGRPDIAITSGQGEAGKTLALLPQRAGGDFGPAVYDAVAPGRWAAAVLIGDINSDGRADLVVALAGNSPTTLAVFRQQADGSLAAAEWLTTYDSPGALALADMDGDGRLDLVVAHSAWNAVGLYLQRSDGTLMAEERFPALYAEFPPQALALGDVNGDGRRDIVAGGSVILQQVSAAQPAARLPAASLLKRLRGAVQALQLRSSP